MLTNNFFILIQCVRQIQSHALRKRHTVEYARIKADTFGVALCKVYRTIPTGGFHKRFLNTESGMEVALFAGQTVSMDKQQPE